jgi:hypothetical protein
LSSPASLNKKEDIHEESGQVAIDKKKQIKQGRSEFGPPFVYYVKKE